VSTTSSTKRRRGSDARQGGRALRAAKAAPKAAAPAREGNKRKVAAAPALARGTTKTPKAPPRARAQEPALAPPARGKGKPAAQPPAARSAAAQRKTQAVLRKPEGAPRKAASTAHPPEAAGEPRYQQVARELKAGIAGGQYPVGARLPTEAELCERFGISRFTAREAVRLLATAGLVTRRQRAGTVVIALPDEARYTPTLASLNDLQQYARDTEMRIVQVGHVALDKVRARAFGAEPGAQWIHAVGIRHETATGGSLRGAAGTRSRVRAGEGRPFCVVRVFLNPILAGIENRLRTRRMAIYSIIESEFGHPIERVEQDLTGTLLDAEDAASLDAAPGTAALCIVRRYYDAGGVLLQVAENVHPADRFTFRMHLHR
jgi:DNA-binding GntR family transcriptional regulator